MNRLKEIGVTKAVGYLAFIGFAVASLIIGEPETESDSSDTEDESRSVVVPFPKKA
jgi:hypothetical protein